MQAKPLLKAPSPLRHCAIPWMRWLISSLSTTSRQTRSSHYLPPQGLHFSAIFSCPSPRDSPPEIEVPPKIDQEHGSQEALKRRILPLQAENRGAEMRRVLFKVLCRLDHCDAGGEGFPIIPHAAAGARCRGCLILHVYEDHADITCNKCGARTHTAPAAEVAIVRSGIASGCC